jgi:hypothetical protein
METLKEDAFERCKELGSTVLMDKEIKKSRLTLGF